MKSLLILFFKLIAVLILDPSLIRSPCVPWSFSTKRSRRRLNLCPRRSQLATESTLHQLWTTSAEARWVQAWWGRKCIFFCSTSSRSFQPGLCWLLVVPRSATRMMLNRRQWKRKKSWISASSFSASTSWMCGTSRPLVWRFNPGCKMCFGQVFVVVECYRYVCHIFGSKIIFPKVTLWIARSIEFRTLSSCIVFHLGPLLLMAWPRCRETCRNRRAAPRSTLWFPRSLSSSMWRAWQTWQLRKRNKPVTGMNRIEDGAVPGICSSLVLKSFHVLHPLLGAFYENDFRPHAWRMDRLLRF